MQVYADFCNKNYARHRSAKVAGYKGSHPVRRVEALMDRDTSSDFGASEKKNRSGTARDSAGDNNVEFQHIDKDASGNVKLVAKGIQKGHVDNPMEGLSRPELTALVDQFIEDYQLEDIKDIIHKGALLAQRPLAYEDIPELTEEDRVSLRNEIDHKWKQPMQMYLTIILCSIGACVQGWDQTGSSGANLTMPKIFGIPNGDKTNPNYFRNNWLVGLISSGPYIGACGVTWLTDPLDHYIGRRGCLFVAAIFCILTPIGSAFCQNWWQLFIVRILLGFGVGFKETAAPILAAENAPTVIRGALVMTWQMWTAFGIFLGYSANLIVHHTGYNIAWRLMVGSAFIPAVPLVVLVYTVPESPRWYIKKDKVRQAWSSLCKLRNTKLQAARDLYTMYIVITAEQHAMRNTNFFQRLCQLFYKNRLRQATLAAFVMMIGREMCGINIIAFFSSSIFQQVIIANGAPAESAETTAMWASFGFGLMNWVFSFPAFFTIDTFGRRSLLLVTFPQMFWTLLAAGLCYLISDNTTRLATVALFIYLFTIAYSVGEGPVPFAYCAEVFPVTHRELGMAWSVFINNLFASILSLTFFRMQAAFTTTGAFCFYAGMNALIFVWVFLWVPETKQLSLEQLDDVFSIPTSEFMRFQIKEEIPYFYHRYIRRDKQYPKPNIFVLPRTEYVTFSA